ncbi:hypothetical protein [Jiangella asiatica]|uniref:Uncharacterized protein n=1 Tax=Jiangella asiatica TaxID=2530372 RepID=A0A4R5D821_9ACTN|nr:hypothetical protein [Jiangella asiatica]TDE09692.1 hypothetical protein E1269_13785 [Jiangella asiatica]
MMNDRNVVPERRFSADDSISVVETATGKRVDRRDFLRLTGMGAGALAAPALLSGGRSVAEAAEVSGTVPNLLRNGTYPVGLWVAPPPGETTVARYAEIADAGFTFVTGIDGCGGFCPPGETATAENAALLDAAAANDLDAIVYDHRISNIQNHPSEQWRDVIESILGEYQDFPAFAGFDIRDEPNASAFAQIGGINDILGQLDPGVLGYVNLFPTYASADMLGTPTYQEHLARYVSEARPDFISFDHYMLVGARPTIREDYFYNWVLVRNQALQAGLPSWVFILACEHYGYRLPTDEELLWQVNVSLAYGCKGIQYFTYWTPPLPGFHEALVTVDGQLTPLYYAAKRINNNYLQPVGKQLLPLTSESVAHFGEAQPSMGVEVFSGDEWVDSASGSAAILSRFHDPKRPNQRWLLVANREFESTANTTLTLHHTISAMFEFDTSERRYVPLEKAEPTGPATLAVHLEPGEAKLYRLHANQGD